MEERAASRQEQSAQRFNEMHENSTALLRNQVAQSTANMERLAEQAAEDVKKTHETSLGQLKKDMPFYIMQTLRDIVRRRGCLQIEDGGVQLMLGEGDSNRSWELQYGDDGEWPEEERGSLCHSEAAASPHVWEATPPFGEENAKVSEEEEPAKAAEEEEQPAKSAKKEGERSISRERRSLPRDLEHRAIPRRAERRSRSRRHATSHRRRSHSRRHQNGNRSRSRPHNISYGRRHNTEATRSYRDRKNLPCTCPPTGRPQPQPRHGEKRRRSYSRKR